MIERIRELNRKFKTLAPAEMADLREENECLKDQVKKLKEMLEGGQKPVAWCFTDVNGNPKEFCDDPKHASEGDLRVRTPLYTHSKE